MNSNKNKRSKQSSLKLKVSGLNALRKSLELKELQYLKVSIELFGCRKYPYQPPITETFKALGVWEARVWS